MRYYRDSRRVTMKHFENLHLHKKIYFVMSDTRNLLLTLSYNISKVVN